MEPAELANRVARLTQSPEWKAFVVLLREDDRIQLSILRVGDWKPPGPAPDACLYHNERIRNRVRSAVAASDLMQDPKVKASGLPDPFSI